MSRAFRVKGLNALTRRVRRKHLSYAIEKSYRSWAQSYIRALPKYPTAWPSEKKAEAFLTGLAQRDVAAATQNQALSAKYQTDSLDRLPRATTGEGGRASCQRQREAAVAPAGLPAAHGALGEVHPLAEGAAQGRASSRARHRRPAPLIRNFINGFLDTVLRLYFLDTPESSGTLGEGKTLKYRYSSQGFFFPP